MFINKIQIFLQAVLTTVYFTHESKTTLENPEGIPGSEMQILLWVSDYKLLLPLQAENGNSSVIALKSRPIHFLKHRRLMMYNVTNTSLQIAFDLLSHKVLKFVKCLVSM